MKHRTQSVQRVKKLTRHIHLNMMVGGVRGARKKLPAELRSLRKQGVIRGAKMTT